MFRTKVTFAPSVRAGDNELQMLTLGHLLISDKWREAVEALRAEPDNEKRRALKRALPCFTPGGVFSHISESGLSRASGFLCADIDCKPEAGINPALAGYDLKANITRLPYVAYCGLSCSGEGYFLIIPIVDSAKYKAYYRAIASDFAKGGITLDKSCSNIAFKRFVSWDDAPYINTAAKPYGYTIPEKEPGHYEKLCGEWGEAETRKRIEELIQRCEAGRIDLTTQYEDWTRILAALANTFGPDGEEYAQRISALYPGYSAEQTSSKYRSFLKADRRPDCAVGIGTIFYLAQRKDLELDFAQVVFADD